jgi:hypothetical protein
VDGSRLLTVVYSGEPDEIHEFAAEGQARLFGRDDEVCDIVIWSEINRTILSRVAGRIWRMDGELWVRNLSTIHELLIIPPEGPAASALLPPRRDETDPGPAQSVPGPSAVIQGPGGCELLVRQERHATLNLPQSMSDEETMRVPQVPDKLLPVAAALCEPLLTGSQLPATYAQIGRRTSSSSLKRTRLQVAELCELYLSELPALRSRVDARRQQEAATLGSRQLPSGITVFDTSDGAPGLAEQDRRRGLNLPDYYEVAHLLVRRRLISRDTVEQLLGALG